jgi:ribosomal protein L40E
VFPHASKVEVRSLISGLHSSTRIMNITGKNFVCFLLVLSLIALVMPHASSQGYTTITSLQTSTNQSTSTQVSTYPMGTSTQSSIVRDTLYDGPFTVPAPPSTYYCQDLEAPRTPFSATAGQTINGIVTSKTIVNFYVLTSADFNNWKHCDFATDHIVPAVSAEEIVSYTMNWKVPKDDSYYFVFVSAWRTGTTERTDGTFKAWRDIPTTSTLTISTTSSAATTMTSLQTLTSLQTSTLTQVAGPFSIGQDVIPYALILIVAAVVIVAAFLMLRRRGAGVSRGRKAQSVPQMQPAPLTRPSNEVEPPRPAVVRLETKVCIHCGQQIPVDARFCTHIGCGKPQELAKTAADMKICIHCGRPIPSDARFCTHIDCGQSQQ